MIYKVSNEIYNHCLHIFWSRTHLWSRCLFGDVSSALSFSSLGTDKCMTTNTRTGKYSNKVRKLLPRRDTIGSITFYGIFLTTLERSLEAAHFSTWLKLSDVYWFSQWHFILASKVFRDGYGFASHYSFGSLYGTLLKFARIFICLQSFLESITGIFIFQLYIE